MGVIGYKFRLLLLILYCLHDINVKTLDELADLLREKLDLGCLSVMSQASLLANQETNNLEYVKGNDNIVLCLWGNLSKNPRFASINYMYLMLAYFYGTFICWLARCKL